MRLGNAIVVEGMFCTALNQALGIPIGDAMAEAEEGARWRCQ